LARIALLDLVAKVGRVCPQRAAVCARSPPGAL